MSYFSYRKRNVRRGNFYGVHASRVNNSRPVVASQLALPAPNDSVTPYSTKSGVSFGYDPTPVSSNQVPVPSVIRNNNSSKYVVGFGPGTDMINRNGKFVTGDGGYAAGKAAYDESIRRANSWMPRDVFGDEAYENMRDALISDTLGKLPLVGRLFKPVVRPPSGPPSWWNPRVRVPAPIDNFPGGRLMPGRIRLPPGITDPIRRRVY